MQLFKAAVLVFGKDAARNDDINQATDLAY